MLRASLMLALAGCLEVHVESTKPMPRDAEVELLGDGTGHAYDVAVAAAERDFLVTWTAQRQHAPDQPALPDTIYSRASGTAQDLTPKAAAQLQSRPFCSSHGCAVAWGDDGPAGLSDRRIMWQPLDGGTQFVTTI